MTTVTYGIKAWSGKTMTARKHYRCRACGGLIPAGTRYLRHVERLGERKGKDPLQNVHIHLDCTTPWYQPDTTHRCRFLAALPQPTSETVPGFTAAVRINSPVLGTLLYLPEAWPTHETDARISVGALAEIEASLAHLLTALLGVRGKRRQAKLLSHLLAEIESFAHEVTHKNGRA